MTYNPNIPQPTNIPSQSQGQILTNFQQLNTIFDEDHVPFNDATAANRGKHDKSTYPEWTMPPQATADPSTAANEVAVYSKDDGSGNTRLYFRQENNGSVFQMSGTDPVPTSAGNTFLPGGLILAWGRNTVSNNFSVTVTSMTTINQVVLTIEDSSATPASRVYVSTVSTNTFSVKVPTGGSAVIRWVAVGVE